MPQITQAGRFRGPILDHAVGATPKQKLPQFICTLAPKLVYNDETGEWQEHLTAETVIAYLPLKNVDAGKFVKTDWCRGIEQAIGWDGISFAGLASGNWKGIEVQFIVEMQEYNGIISPKVTRIEHKDAEIGLRKLSAAEIAEYDQRFFGGPKSQPAKTPVRKAVLSKPITTPLLVAAPAKSPPAVSKSVMTPASVTEQDAYNTCLAANKEQGEKAVPQKILDDYWTAAATELIVDLDNPTGEEWAKVRDKVIENITIPF